MKTKIVPFFIVPVLAAYVCTRPLYARAEDYTYTDVCIDWIDNCIGLLSPVELTIAPVVKDVNAMQIAKQELRRPSRTGNLSDACDGSVGYYYNNDGALRMASVPTDFDTNEHVNTSACICTSPDFSIYVSQIGYPDTDSFYMTYFSTSTTCGVHLIHSGSSPDWYREVEVDGGDYFTSSPWQFTTSANTCNVSVASLRSTSTIPTISPSYNPPSSPSGMSLTLFGQASTTSYPANISDVAIYQLYTPAVLHAWLSEVAADLESNAPGLDLPPVPSPASDPTEPPDVYQPVTDENGQPVTNADEQNDWQYSFNVPSLPYLEIPEPPTFDIELETTPVYPAIVSATSDLLSGSGLLPVLIIVAIIGAIIFIVG